MIILTPHAEGTVIVVRAQPGSRKNGVVGAHGGALKIAVSAAPERGKANAAIALVLAETLRCRTGQITLLSGQTAREKRFLITQIAFDELKRRIDAVLEPVQPR
jgi:uncharacterized protein (TIGR00251 family)